MARQCVILNCDALGNWGSEVVEGVSASCQNPRRVCVFRLYGNLALFQAEIISIQGPESYSRLLPNISAAWPPENSRYFTRIRYAARTASLSYTTSSVCPFAAFPSTYAINANVNAHGRTQVRARTELCPLAGFSRPVSSFASFSTLPRTQRTLMNASVCERLLAMFLE